MLIQPQMDFGNRAGGQWLGVRARIASGDQHRGDVRRPQLGEWTQRIEPNAVEVAAFGEVAPECGTQPHDVESAVSLGSPECRRRVRRGHDRDDVQPVGAVNGGPAGARGDGNPPRPFVQQIPLAGARFGNGILELDRARPVLQLGQRTRPERRTPRFVGIE
ncbi:Uncharacterised protein [Mycobacterium tuberculosis]|uniref:Uncharacterized protein n=1 Tax=Mycobacterium tuberculosis TaxID=1773 RepID=A0A655AFX0_MYCTX|nr:Uncharacterised protein [Mycobacterium tuberculosis]CNV50859.1 Uncharacterised protein [Mycobacterium tuberculosis]